MTIYDTMALDYQIKHRHQCIQFPVLYSNLFVVSWVTGGEVNDEGKRKLCPKYGPTLSMVHFQVWEVRRLTGRRTRPCAALREEWTRNCSCASP